jgi:hypothetical protein
MAMTLLSRRLPHFLFFLFAEGSRGKVLSNNNNNQAEEAAYAEAEGAHQVTKKRKMMRVIAHFCC